MTPQSRKVFAAFGSGFVALVLILIGANSFAQESVPSVQSSRNVFQSTTGDELAGRTIMERNGCFACHSIDGFGGSVGPALNGVGKRKTQEELFRWIQSPSTIKPGTRMPQFPLSDQEIKQIISYLETKDSLTVHQ